MTFPRGGGGILTDSREWPRGLLIKAEQQESISLSPSLLPTEPWAPNSSLTLWGCFSCFSVCWVGTKMSCLSFPAFLPSWKTVFLTCPSWFLLRAVLWLSWVGSDTAGSERSPCRLSRRGSWRHFSCHLNGANGGRCDYCLRNDHFCPGPMQAIPLL